MWQQARHGYHPVGASPVPHAHRRAMDHLVHASRLGDCLRLIAGWLLTRLTASSTEGKKMSAPFLAMIIPVSAGTPTHPIAPGGSPGAPTHPIYNPAYPSHPIYNPPPYPDQGLPGQPPYPSQGLPGAGGMPSHPIVLPPIPPEIWPQPGHPSHPIVIPPGAPGYPSQPIYLPPGFWGGAPLPGVSHPIELPPPPEDGAGKPPPAGGGWGYHPDYGWGYFPMGQAAGPKR